MKGARLRFIATRYPHWGNHAGIGQFTKHLDRQRYRVDYHLVADNDSQLPLPGARLRERLRDRVQQSGMAWYKLSDLAAELRALGASLAGRAQLVHFLDGEHGAQFLPQWLAAMPGRDPPLVASYHQPAQLLPTLVDPKVLTLLDAVVLVAPSQRGFFEAFMPAEKIVTILHGIDTDYYRPGALPDDGIFRCVTAGHWLRDWGAMKRAAKALREHSDIEFHVVTNRVTGLEGLPNVRIHNGLTDGELLTLYQRCDLGLLPLTDSTANNSLLEFIACGLPLLSTDLEAVRAYVGDDEAVLLSPGEGAGFAQAILDLRDDLELCAGMGRAARRRAEQLAWPNIAAEYAQLYSRLLTE
ncbi:MAG: glycosyltransferase family 4 protein [Novosphingobium sp.]